MVLLLCFECAIMNGLRSSGFAQEKSIIVIAPPVGSDDLSNHSELPTGGFSMLKICEECQIEFSNSHPARKFNGGGYSSNRELQKDNYVLRKHLKDYDHQYVTFGVSRVNANA